MKKEIDLKEVKSIRYHDSLPEDLIERIKRIYPIISQVYPISLDKWIDGFNYDMHPIGEIEIWEETSKRLEYEWKLNRAKTKEQKREIFKKIIEQSGWGKIEITKATPSA